jgi:hypothetical protein
MKIFSPPSRGETEIFRPLNKRRGVCQDSAPGNSQRRKKETKTEVEMGRQHHIMDRIETELGGQMCELQGWMERTG